MANLSNPASRFDFLDYIKGVLIFLVVYGHVIQYVEYKDSGLFWFNPVYKIIYMFHMPLFMAISGFLAYNSIQKKSFYDILKSRIKTLIVPIIFFAVLKFTLSILLDNDFTLRQLPAFFIKSIIGNLWFLWALFYATVIVAFMRKYNFDKTVFLVLVLIAILILPDRYDSPLYKFTFFYFLLGYVVAKYSIHNYFQNSIKRNNILLVLSLLLTAFFFFIWNKNMYVYVSGMEIFSINILTVLLRFLIGIVCSLAFLLLFRKIYQWRPTPAIIELGRNSIYIYILQDIAVSFFKRSTFPECNSLLFTMIVSPIVALVVVFVSLYIGNISQRWRLMQIAFGRFNR
ncbi:MAG TPA: acyltransferase family protein [Bacteroidia bacterium]|nr:acyltransferase family protein [Bacteroidia bacterium]